MTDHELETIYAAFNEAPNLFAPPAHLMGRLKAMAQAQLQLKQLSQARGRHQTDAWWLYRAMTLGVLVGRASLETEQTLALCERVLYLAARKAIRRLLIEGDVGPLELTELTEQLVELLPLAGVEELLKTVSFLLREGKNSSLLRDVEGALQNGGFCAEARLGQDVFDPRN